MGVMFQAFYWDCWQASGHGNWWRHLAGAAESLAEAGFTALWLPPVSKAASIFSMGYDPYDYFDLGEHDQKGGVSTAFGTRAELEALVQGARALGLQVYADMVLDHNSGGDQQEQNGIDGLVRWTSFTPVSGLFLRDWECFHPSPFEQFDDGVFGEMPDLCHRHPTVYGNLLEYARVLVEDVGFDGFRFDFVKGYSPWMVRAIAERRYRGATFRPYCVGECWDNARSIDEWLADVNAFSDNPVSAFDFPLHYRLKAMCDTDDFDLRDLVSSATSMQSQPDLAVTFVDNHDTDRDPHNAVVRDKLLAYAYILTHEGYPCVYWRDWFERGLARVGEGTGIWALVRVHEEHAAGDSRILHAGPRLYVMQRVGGEAGGGLILVLNTSDEWAGVRVAPSPGAASYRAVAWWGANDASRPSEQQAAPNGTVGLWSAGRGYAVFVAG